ncbi:MAG: VanZ family protein [Firmicutes bacterium HGW-Firmicutes-1]|jgi:glycopeptide antibiotics resistance protein|nr:MAG: VanZ family protein [Firmicutes bacterium HGW-Firmicutes-1]
MIFSVQFKKSARMLCVLLFYLYLFFLAYLLFLSPSFGRTLGVPREYNLLPFKTISNYIIYRDYVNTKTLIINIIGNVVAFMPMGFFVPILFRKKRSFWKVILFSACVSLIVELLQFKFVVGSFDVDDIILNTFGGAIGFVIYNLLYRIYELLRHPKKGKT